MTPANLLSQSAGEILGIYSPGSAPTVRDADGLPVDVTHAHEQGHRELCDTTSLGQYLVALAIASERASTAQGRADARRGLQEAVEQCWLVQEGYATCRQLAYCHGMNRPDLAARVEASLPTSYAAALGHFPVDPVRLEQDVGRLFGPGGPATHELVRIGLEYAAYVIAKAAMSIPVARALEDAAALPAFQVSLMIRGHAPDVRLRALRDMLTPDFTRGCLIAVLDATRAARERGVARPLDERLEELCRWVCGRTGLAYEPSYDVHLPGLLGKLGCGHLRVEQRDGRDVPTAAMGDYEFDVHVVGANDHLSILRSVPVDLAEHLYQNHFGRAMAGLKPHVVCELGARDDHDQTVAWLHAYATKAEVSGLLARVGAHEASRLAAAAHPDAAMQQLLLSVTVPAADAEKLPGRFPHRAWDWLVGDVLIGDAPNRWNLTALRRAGGVYAVPLADVGFHDRRVRRSYAIPQGLVEEGSPREGVGYTRGVPDNAVLVVFDGDPRLPGAEVVRVATLSYRLRRGLPVAPFGWACVADALLQGFYSYHVLSTRLRGEPP
jgi:hypothetical protein